MTESALEKARLEVEKALVGYGKKSQDFQVRLVEICDLLAALGAVMLEVARLEAAAHLAGRLEQAERSVALSAGESRAIDGRLREERDRLRLEAG